MPDTKITALTAITTVNPATSPLVIVDLTDTTMAASGTTKKVTANQILGSGGTATLASAAITGDLTVRTTGLTVNSSGVGVGVTAALGAGNIQIGAGKYLGFSGTAYITPEDNVQGARIKANQVLIDATDAKFNIGGSEAMRLNVTGLAIGDTAFAGTRLTLRESASQPNALAITNRNATQTWRIGVDVSAVDDKILGFYDSTSTTFRMQLTDTGHLGIGVTPSAWTAYKALQINTLSSLSASSGSTDIALNWRFDISNKYIANGFASSYTQFNGSHIFNIAGNNTLGAGAALTWTPAMTLDASGNLILLSSNTPATLATNGQLTMNATSNTNLRFSYRGSDGITRVANLTLA